MLLRPFGKGKVLWSAAPIENDERRAHRRFFLRLLRELLDYRSPLETNAPRRVELVTFREEDTFRISAVDLCADDETTVIPRFEIRLSGVKKPQRVLRLARKEGEPDEELPFTWQDGAVAFSTEPLTVFDMYMIE